ncbi:MAG: ABC transporter ATP-binding protein, partial [Mogibacterium sp.]|nr:ABC transporter ATP-binding protein [Mogibacterium sp.]
MLELKGITKEYMTGAETVHALRGIDLAFRESEFVSILGPSGCGKTTMLNILGGLDQYTSGDLLIDGISTKEYRDADWDAYRNDTIGFVFQSYNLISHQTVLSNVELALTLSGVSAAERRERAIAALEQVGLGDQINKKPAEMSGGQVQRVAIARALINDPSIILADEPTGALDTETSTQVMAILKGISEDRLVIMVTHNPDLAEAYSTRIVRLSDGQVISDSDPFDPGSYDAGEGISADQAVISHRQKSGGRAAGRRNKSMSMGTALHLSLNNLMTKKARTLLTAFAGSIGIIGIALILSVSNGFQTYIDKLEEDTLSSYPLTIMSETADMTSMITAFMANASDTEGEESGDKLHEQQIMTDLLASVGSNDLASFKKHIDSNIDTIGDWFNSYEYSYGLSVNIYST